MSEKKEKKKFDFYEWYESDPVKRGIGAVYSLGASVVIIGALFKIMHFPGAGAMLMVGMLTEAVLFAIGVFDKPHVEYKWENIFPALTGKSPKPLTSAGAEMLGVANNSILTTPQSEAKVNVAANIAIPELDPNDMKKLSTGIKSLVTTTEQLSSLSSSLVEPADKFAKTIDAANAATEKFAGSQEKLNKVTQDLETSYQTITADMNKIVTETNTYAEKIDKVNANLSSLNSVYELQLKNIQAQSELFGQQQEKVKMVSGHLEQICAEASKIQQSVAMTAKESEKYQIGISKLSEQIADLNKVYGNMLNALS